MSTSLYINRAHSTTNAKQVKDVLEQVFKEDIVKSVDVLEKTDTNTGEKFKTYFIHFSKSNAIYDAFIKRVNMAEKGVRIVYDDKEHFWNVSKFVKKTKTDPKDDEKRAGINLKKMGGGLPTTAKYQGGHIETWKKANANAK